jgi:cobalt-zinc-cadmium efflux system protein
MSTQRRFLIAIGLNLAFAITEIIFGLQANSTGLLADAGHNLSDVFGLSVAGVAQWLLQFKPNDRYSYGYKKATILAALLNVFMLLLASYIITHDALNKLHALLNAEPVQFVNSNIIIITASLGVFFNGLSAALFLRDRNHDLNIKGAYLNLFLDTLLSVGIVCTGIIIHFTHWFWLDPIVGILIVSVILYSIWGLLQETVSLLLNAVPRHIQLPQVRAYLETIPNVISVHELHVWGLSTQDIALTAHLVMSPTTAALLTHTTLQDIEQALLAKFGIHHMTLQMEYPEQNKILD